MAIMELKNHCVPSISSQAVMGKERNLSPWRQTDGQMERALCLRSPHSGESAEPEGEIRESLAALHSLHGLRQYPYLT